MSAAPPTDRSPEVTRVRAACPICQADNRQSPALPSPYAEWDLKRCRGCGLVYLGKVLQESQLEVVHSWSHSYRATRDVQLQTAMGRFRYRWRKLRQRLLPHRKAVTLIHQYVDQGTVLDVGCGSGALFERLRDSIVPMGIEVGRKAAAAAAQRAQRRGGRVLCADAMSGLRSLGGASLDGVLMSSYLEHENEPLAALREVVRVLCPGGVAIIKVPNYACWNRHLRGWRWPGFRLPDHVNYFTPRTLREIVTRSGLEIARFAWRDRSPLSDNMWLVARKAAARSIAVPMPGVPPAVRRAS
jgi:SAM-dependent methyltransferase